jgi:hypothetical protein
VETGSEVICIYIYRERESERQRGIEKGEETEEEEMVAGQEEANI